MVTRKIWLFIALYVGWALGTLYIVFGLCKAWTLASRSTQLLGMFVYLGLAMIPIWLYRRWVWGSPGWAKKVRARGKQATATILSVKDTPMVVNFSNAVVKLRLRVEPPDEAPFEISQEKLVSMVPGVGGYAAGDRVEVRYDPENRNHMIIGDAVAPSGHRAGASRTVPQTSNSSSDVTEKLEELSKLHESGELSDPEFAAAKKTVLDKADE